MARQLISQEMFTSVQKVQAGISRLFKTAAKKKHFYRVMRNQEPLGVLIPNNLWDELVEDLETLSSPTLRNRIEKSRKSKKRYSASEVKRLLKL